MIETQVWRTMDGEVFEDRSKAQAHEDAYIASWMDDMACTPNNVLAMLDNTHSREFFGTARAMGKLIFDILIQVEHNE